MTSRKSLLVVAIIPFFVWSVVGQMKMHIINVGQAESIILEFENHAILVDAGSEKPAEKEHLFAYLEQFFAGRPDLDDTFHSVIVSHPHPDHTTNLKGIFEKYTIQNFVEGGHAPNSAVTGIRNRITDEGAVHYKAYARSVKRASFMRDWRDELLNGSNADLRFLSAGRACNDANNASLVLRVEYKGRSLLLLGDAEEDDLKRDKPGVGCGGLLFRLLNKRAAFPDLLDVDVIKVAHHGARNGTIEPLLEKVTPMFAVISAGDNTRGQVAGSFSAWGHGHPNTDSVNRLVAFVSKTRPTKSVSVMSKQESAVQQITLTKAIYSTGWDGDIVFTVTAAGVLQNPVLIPN